jgi:hypothetical protein
VNKVLLSLILSGILIVIITGYVTLTPTSEPTAGQSTLNKLFIERNAKIGLTKEEVKDIFGAEEMIREDEERDLWLYYSTDDHYEYKSNIEKVLYEEINSGAVTYQLYIEFINDKTYRYHYFYKGDHGKVMKYIVHPTKRTEESEAIY